MYSNKGRSLEQTSHDSLEWNLKEKFTHFRDAAKEDQELALQ